MTGLGCKAISLVMKSPSRLIGLLLGIALWGSSLSAFTLAQSFPSYSGHVNDFANVIDSGTKQQLETLLLNFEKKTGTQIAVVTIQSLNDRSIEDYATNLYRTWGIGAKSGENRDKGALLLVSMQDRKMRLETGYALEADLPDGMAGEILRRMKPYFKQEQYSQGITVAVRTLVDTLAAKWNVSLEGIEDRRYAYRGDQPQELSGKGLGALVILFFVFIIFMSFIGRFARRRTSGVGQALWWLAPLIFNRGGGGFGGGSWGGGSSGGGWGGGDSGGGGGGWGGFGGGESGGGGASDSW